MGSGRVVAFGHEGIMSNCVTNAAWQLCPVVSNSVLWATRSDRTGPPRVAGSLSKYANLFTSAATGLQGRVNGYDGSASGRVGGGYLLSTSAFRTAVTQVCSS